MLVTLIVLAPGVFAALATVAAVFISVAGWLLALAAIIIGIFAIGLFVAYGIDAVRGDKKSSAVEWYLGPWNGRNVSSSRFSGEASQALSSPELDALKEQLKSLKRERDEARKQGDLEKLAQLSSALSETMYKIAKLEPRLRTANMAGGLKAQSDNARNRLSVSVIQLMAAVLIGIALPLAAVHHSINSKSPPVNRQNGSLAEPGASGCLGEAAYSASQAGNPNFSHATSAGTGRATLHFREPGGRSWTTTYFCE